MHQQGRVDHVYNAPAASLLEAITFMLQRAVDANAKVKVTRPACLEDGPFSFPWASEWQSVHEFVTQLVSRLRCSPEVLVAAVCLLARLEKTPPLPALTQVTVHRAFLACAVLALKVHDDCVPAFADLAKMGKLSVAELKAMELGAFKALSFQCHVTAGEFTAHHLCLRGFDTLRRRGARGTGPSALPVVSIGDLCDRMVDTLNPTPCAGPTRRPARLHAKAAGRGRLSDPGRNARRTSPSFRRFSHPHVPVPVAILVDD